MTFVAPPLVRTVPEAPSDVGRLRTYDPERGKFSAVMPT
jgi:hypothetical protein